MRVNETRIRQNQFLFREVNQRIAEITRGQGEQASEFICECGEAGCTSVMDLPLADYEAVRGEREDLFIAAEGHCVEGVDRLVETRAGYDVVTQM